MNEPEEQMELFEDYEDYDDFAFDDDYVHDVYLIELSLIHISEPTRPY